MSGLIIPSNFIFNSGIMLLTMILTLTWKLTRAELTQVKCAGRFYVQWYLRHLKGTSVLCKMKFGKSLFKVQHFNIMDKRARAQELYVNFQFSSNSRSTTLGEHRDIMSNTGSMVSNIVIASYGSRWLLGIVW